MSQPNDEPDVKTFDEAIDALTAVIGDESQFLTCMKNLVAKDISFRDGQVPFFNALLIDHWNSSPEGEAAQKCRAMIKKFFALELEVVATALQALRWDFKAHYQLSISAGAGDSAGAATSTPTGLVTGVFRGVHRGVENYKKQADDESLDQWQVVKMLFGAMYTKPYGFWARPLPLDQKNNMAVFLQLFFVSSMRGMSCDAPRNWSPADMLPSESTFDWHDMFNSPRMGGNAMRALCKMIAQNNDSWKILVPHEKGTPQYTFICLALMLALVGAGQLLEFAFGLVQEGKLSIKWDAPVPALQNKAVNSLFAMLVSCATDSLNESTRLTAEKCLRILSDKPDEMKKINHVNSQIQGRSWINVESLCLASYVRRLPDEVLENMQNQRDALNLSLSNLRWIAGSALYANA